MADFWNTDWLTRNEMFAPLRPVAAGLPAIGWPDLDLLNALAWLAFPTTKAVINARNYESMTAAGRGNRPPQRDALTLFDEDGVAVVSSDAELLELVRGFRWKELFWQQRDAVKARMRFCVFGHALFSKALQPFVGLTGKAVLLHVPGAFLERDQAAQLAELDHLLATYTWNRERFLHGRELSPLPVLGVPGWWSGNEREGFYDNTAYFRPGRRQPTTTVSSR